MPDRRIALSATGRPPKNLLDFSTNSGEAEGIRGNRPHASMRACELDSRAGWTADAREFGSPTMGGGSSDGRYVGRRQRELRRVGNAERKRLRLAPAERNVRGGVKLVSTFAERSIAA